MNKNSWIHPQTITGPPAEGTKYFPRTYINDELWREIEKGAHILIAAPRRVGKTSIMKDIVNREKEGYLCIFENIQSVNTKSGFYKRLYFLLLNQLGSFKKSQKLLTKWLRSKGIEEINWDGGIKFKDLELDYKDELLSLIAKLPELEQRVVLFVDEFSEVVFRIKNKETKDNAIDILHTLREIRSKEPFKNCFFVLSGSVGLDHVVESMDRLTLINDLYPLKIGALNKEESKEFIQQLVESATMQVDDSELDYINRKLVHLVPYFIQLLIDECDRILHDENRTDLNNEDIDQAFENIIKTQKNLNDWEDRLKPPYLTKEAFHFCKEILTRIAHFEKISIQEIYDISSKYNQSDDYMNHKKTLMNDGYLNELSEGVFQFTSPLLKSWWQKQHPKFELEK